MIEKKMDNRSELITNEQPVKVAQTSEPKIETPPLPIQPAARASCLHPQTLVLNYNASLPEN